MNSDTQKFQSLINKEKYQVFILACPTYTPFNFARHSWFVIKKHFWKAKLMGYIEGSENSTAQKIIEFIENSEKIYLYCFKYSFFGPNSNTYIQWVLDKFPEFNVKLSWNFIGKGFKS